MSQIDELYKKYQSLENEFIKYRRYTEDLFENLDMSNMPSVKKTLASFKSDTVTSLAQIKAEADANGASVSLLASWKSTVTDPDGNITTGTQTIAELQAQANASGATVGLLAQWKTGITNADGEIISGLYTLAEIKNEAFSTGAKISAVVSGVMDTDGKVTSASIVAEINSSGSLVSINADKINFTGFTTFVRPGDLSTSGATTINGNNIVTGTILASKLNITDFSETGAGVGGWNINPSYIGTSETDGSFYLSSAIDNSNYWIRAHDSANGGGNLKFAVTRSGGLFATGANISGIITASSGNFSNCVISNSCTIGSDISSSSGIRFGRSYDTYDTRLYCYNDSYGGINLLSSHSIYNSGLNIQPYSVGLAFCKSGSKPDFNAEGSPIPGTPSQAGVYAYVSESTGYAYACLSGYRVDIKSYNLDDVYINGSIAMTAANVNNYATAKFG